MNSTLCISFGLALFASTLAAQAPAPTGKAPGARADDPQLPYTPSLDLTAMDRTADPCVDFYQFACGGWIKNNPIPPDQSSWSTYGKMQDDNRTLLRALLEQAGAGRRLAHAEPAEDRRLLRRLHGRGGPRERAAPRRSRRS